jgi:hypothetical protein
MEAVRSSQNVSELNQAIHYQSPELSPLSCRISLAEIPSRKEWIDVGRAEGGTKERTDRRVDNRTELLRGHNWHRPVYIIFETIFLVLEVKKYKINVTMDLSLSNKVNL